MGDGEKGEGRGRGKRREWEENGKREERRGGKPLIRVSNREVELFPHHSRRLSIQPRLLRAYRVLHGTQETMLLSLFSSISTLS